MTETTFLVVHVAQIHQMMKSMMTPCDTPIFEPTNVLIDVGEVACVYCRGAHLFEEYSVNLVSISYMENKKYNNPYSNTYNSGW